MRATLAFWLLAACTSESVPEEARVASRRQLAAGRWTDLDIDGSSAEGGFVVALEDPDADGGNLTLIPFETGARDACRIGRARAYGSFGVHWESGVRLSDRPVRVSYFESLDEGVSGPLRFADARCEVRPPVLDADVVAPVLYDFVRGEGFFVRTAAGEVHLLEPWDESSALLATGVSRMEAGPAYGGTTQLWLIEDAELVVRSQDGEELGRFGNGVRDLAVAWDGVGAAFVDDDGLFVVRELDEPAALLVAGDACEPRFFPGLPGFLPTIAAALSPCEDRRLVLVDVDTADVLELESGVAAVRRVGEWYFWVLGDSRDVRTGPLRALRLGDDPVAVGEGGDLQSVLDVEAELFLLQLDHDGEKGRLGLWAPSLGFLEIATGVAEYVLYGRLTVLRDYDGETGTLEVRGGVSWTEPPVLTAHRVPRGGFRYSRVVWALDYLEDWDPEAGTGRLQTFLVEDEIGFTIDEDVSEFTEITWPDGGMLYSIGRGDRAGLWFADWVE